MTTAWVPLDDLLDGVLAGRFTTRRSALGTLAAGGRPARPRLGHGS